MEISLIFLISHFPHILSSFPTVIKKKKKKKSIFPTKVKLFMCVSDSNFYHIIRVLII